MKLLRRKKRHVHMWTKWELAGGARTHPRTGARVPFTAQLRRCTDCNFTEVGYL